MTPLDSGVGLGDPPAARLTPPIASSAMNAPTAAVAPFRTLRRVAPPSPAGVVPLLSINTLSSPLASSARDPDALDQHPDDGQPSQCEDVRADAGWQSTGFTRSGRRRHRLSSSRYTGLRRSRGRLRRSPCFAGCRKP